MILQLQSLTCHTLTIAHHFYFSSHSLIILQPTASADDIWSFSSTPLYSITMTTVQATPQFFICRPEGRVTPLVAVDQLPSWLWIRGADRANPNAMISAFRGMVPREGEYDVVCRNCYSTIDNLHRSTSQRYDGPAPPPAPSPPLKQACRFSGARGPLYKTDCSLIPGASTYFRLPFVDLSGVNACVQNPYVGMCLLECPWPLNTSRLASVFPASMAAKGPFSPVGSESSSESKLNPEAADFKPLDLPAPYALPSPTRAHPLDSTIFHFESSNPESDLDSRFCPGATHTGTNEGTTMTPVRISQAMNNTSAALEQLKRSVGICRDMESYESEPSFSMSRYLVGKEGGRRPGRDDRDCRGGRVRKPRTKRMGARKVAFPGKQVNAATKRQERREKMYRNMHQNTHRNMHGRGKQSPSRYWHMRASWRARV